MHQVSGGSNGNVPHGPPDPYYYYVTILEYLVICCWPYSIDTFDFIFGCFFGYFCCCFSEILRYAYFVLLLIHSILRDKMQNVIYTCLMKASIIWIAVLCNDFKPWEEPWQQTCKITVIFFTRHSLTRHSPFAPLCKVDDWLTKRSLEDGVDKSNLFPIHVLSRAVLWVTSWKNS